jgi:hypothetical protein
MGPLTYKVSNLHFYKQSETSHLTLATTISLSNVSYSILNALPQAEVFFFNTLALSLPLLKGTRRLTTFVTLSIQGEPFLEPSALIPLPNHEGAVGGSSSLGLRTTIQVSWKRAMIDKMVVLESNHTWELVHLLLKNPLLLVASGCLM